MSAVVDSARFASAVRAERRRLERRRDRIRDELEAVESRIAEIAPLAPAQGPASDGLRGREIRSVAVTLLREDRGTAPIHYRDWLRLVELKGYRVAGKRPDSVFLNQITRSPIVRATTSRGYYQLTEAAG